MKFEVTLKEHIWFLFEEESSINNFYDFLGLENYQNGNDIWIDTLLTLNVEKKLDRRQLLIATIYTATKGFNKRLSGTVRTPADLKVLCSNWLLAGRGLARACAPLGDRGGEGVAIGLQARGLTGPSFRPCCQLQDH